MAMATVGDYTITSLETITAFDISTGAFLFVLDELQDATISQTQDKQDITGKQGRKISSLKRNKAVTVSGNNGLVSIGLLAMQTGGEIENKVTNVMWTDYLTVNSNAATTSYKAIGTAGNEIEAIYVLENGVAKTKLEQDATAAEGKFAYDPSTKALTFSGLADGTEVVAYYTRKIQADVLENYSDKYSGKCQLYIDAMVEDKCANVYRMQFYIPKADFNGEFDFSFSGLKTSFLYTLRDAVKQNPNFVEENKANLCASLQKTIVDILLDKLVKASKATGIKDIAIAGGVSANSGLRNGILEMGKRRGWRCFLPELKFTTDNAAMIAVAGYYQYLAGKRSSLDVAPVSRAAELEIKK